jgi:predicted nucleotidyltransferase
MLKNLLAKPLSPDEMLCLVEEEKKLILNTCPVEELYLFGSASRAQMTEASDLDFLVVVADDQSLKCVKKNYYNRKKTSIWPVDIIFMHRSDFEHKSRIGGVAMICKAEGKLLFKKENHV